TRHENIFIFPVTVFTNIGALTILISSRLLCGWYANLHLTKTIHLLTMTITLISTSLMLLPLANNYLSLAIFTGFYGFFFGTTVAVHITVLAEVVGMSDFDSALGLFMLIRSIGGFLGPPLAGKFILSGARFLFLLAQECLDKQANNENIYLEQAADPYFHRKSS
uniref:Major facilitator superfamily (MFS) profile domain-containing protein n=1 Tax=Phasianus colchicus TaxID=9054 RepID=A0A669QR61_PHACC